ncbi:MAG: hypothetical protein HQK72_00685 [Desulfamplus sp.]|nr:hypothetical protein [Desulfamplus sp.]
MKPIIAILISLLFITAFSISYTNAADSSTKSNNNVVIVYYFHREFRCPSCTTLERVTKESVESAFDKELKSGRVKLMSVNIDKKENEHFFKDYSLKFQSVVISDVRDGKEKRWKNLDQVWKLLKEEWDLREYIQKEIRLYI